MQNLEKINTSNLSISSIDKMDLSVLERGQIKWIIGYHRNQDGSLSKYEALGDKECDFWKKYYIPKSFANYIHGVGLDNFWEQYQKLK